MSAVIPVHDSEALQADIEERRQQLRKRLMLAAVTVVLIAGLAAVPIPARLEFEALLTEIASLEDSVQGYRDQDRQLAAWAARIGEEPEDLAARARLWLGPADSILLRNQLIAIAGPIGLHLNGVSVEEGLRPLADDEVMASLAMVLGTVAGGAEQDAWGDEGEDDDDWGKGSASVPKPALTATRYTIRGSGTVSGVVLFSGLLRQLPEPLRLFSLDLTMDEDGARFTLVADRLHCPLRDDLEEGMS